MIKAYFSGNTISSSSIEAFNLNDKSAFGEKKGKKIEYASFEALYLKEEGKMQIFSQKEELSFEKLLKILRKKDKKIETKLVVYKDLRNKGYVIKTALKFGAEFRAYNKGIKPGENHAKWILFTSNENEVLKWHDFVAKNRIAHSTKKSLLIAIVDEEADVSYYDCSWHKP